MAKYLVIEFDNDETCDKLKQTIDQATSSGKAYRAVGEFKKPTSWCGCPRPAGYYKNEIARGGRFGWWVHRECRKPRLGSHQLANLIKPRKTNEEGFTLVIGSLSVFEVPTRNLHG